MQVRQKLLRHSATLVAVLAFLSVPSSSVSAQTYIFNRADFPTGSYPQALVTGDFNGDGLPDLALANGFDNTVSILLGEPGGGFAAHVDYAAGANPVAIVTGDFNGDGKLDLAVVDTDGDNVSVLLGNGDGTFHGRLVYGVGSLPGGITAGDFNGDGKLDLAVTNYSDNTISVLLGNGDGTFQAQQTYPVGLEPTSVAAGDLNGDGKLDLAVSVKNCPAGPCSPGFVSVLLGKGDGTFAAHVDYTADIGPASVAIGDLNGDGKPDLAVVTLNGTVSILLNNGDGTFQPHVDYAGGGGLGLVLSDFNGDGKLDLAVNGGGGVISVLIGNGDGTFQAHADYAVSNNPSGTSIVASDFNGDGKVDLAVFSNGACVLLGNGNGTFGALASYATGNAPVSEVAADFNGDGKPDLAVANSGDSTVSILLNNGDGTFKNQVTYAISAQPGQIAVGDFRGDGKLDLVVPVGIGFGGSPGFVYVLLGNGDGTFQPHVDYGIGNSFGDLAVAVGDFNGDGKLDLAVGNSGHGGAILSVLLGNGDGTFQSPINTTTGNSGGMVAVGDFNGDGKLDVAIAEESSVAVLLGKGDGTFQSPVHYPTGCGSSVAVADLTGNGKLDLLVGGEPCSNGSAVLLGNGDGTFKFGGEAPGDLPADLNGDGKIDVFEATLNGFLVALGNGDGTFQTPIIVGSSGIGQAVAADFRGDGVLGLAGTMAPVGPVLGSVEVMLDTPVIALSPRSLSFSAVLGTNSAPRTVTVTNAGATPLALTNISASADYSETNSCGANLASGASCTIDVTFSPLAGGTLNGALSIADGAPTSPQVIALTGTAINSPIVTLSPSSLSFGGQLATTTAAAQSVTLTNKGDASLQINSIAASGDFAVAASGTTCSTASPLASGANCTIAVTFTPTGGGNQSGSLSISDNAPGNPQSLALSGTGEDFSIGPASGSSTSATVTAGQSATYSLNITPIGGFNLMVSLACSGEPAEATCSVSPSSTTLNGATVATVTVTTTGRSLVTPRPQSGPAGRHGQRFWLPGLWLAALALLFVLAARRRRALVGVAIALAAALLWAACGGGSGSMGGGKSGTPAGSYTLTVTGAATSGSSTLSQKVTLTLTVN